MKKLLFPFLFLAAFNAYSLTFPTIITATGISSTNSLAAAKANRIALQNAVNSCTDPLGCTVRIIDKDAFIEAAQQMYPNGSGQSDPSDCTSSAFRGISVPSNVRVSLSRSYLKVFPSKCQSYSIFRFWSVHDSELVMDKTSIIFGDKTVHDYTYTGQGCSSAGATHECGHLVSVTDSQNIVILHGTLTQATGDGLYIGGDNSLGNNITVKYVAMDNNRRQGMSIISGSNITIEQNYLTNTGSGTNTATPPANNQYIAPGLGLDVEVNGCNQRVINLKVRYNYFGNNKGGAFKSYNPVCPNDRNITTDDVYQNVLLAHNTINELGYAVTFSNSMNWVAEFNNISTASSDAFTFAGSQDVIVRRNTVEKTGAIAGYLATVDTGRVNVGNVLQDNIYFNFGNLIYPTNTTYPEVTLDSNLNSNP